MSLASEVQAGRVFVTGSLARGEPEYEIGERPHKPEASDCDFYVPDFNLDGSRMENGHRATLLVAGFRQVLAPFGVDVRPLPGYVDSAEVQEGFRINAVPLEDLA